MAAASPTTRQELQAKVIERALKDEAFRKELLSNPTSTIFKELGIEYVPGGPKFQVLEETPNLLYLVLPMSQEQLSAVANSPQALADQELQSLKQRSSAYVALAKSPI